MMKMLIVCSEKSSKLPENEFYIKTDSRFANSKFIPNMIDSKEVCTVCGRRCMWCRGRYKLNFKDSISEIVKLPDLYRKFEDFPLKYLPSKFKEHDIAVLLGIHEDIIVEIPKLLHNSGGKALIAACESGKWVSKWTREKLVDECKKNRLQYAFPKPFCTLNYGKFPLINEFIDTFKIGKPNFRLFVDNRNIIRKAEVIISAPCGNGYNIARHLEGKKLGEEARRALAKYWHSYPCLGDMHIDGELGDTPLHIAGYTHYSALERAEIIRI
ncbi:putative Thymidylate synthase [Clostridiaceae bacterium BL-3]|nr:putative Thymidylate synthase [Clostridiaceae bacterium BL-3]